MVLETKIRRGLLYRERVQRPGDTCGELYVYRCRLRMVRIHLILSNVIKAKIYDHFK